MSTDLHSIRRTQNLNIVTPLLIPSFSSRGFPGLMRMIEAIRSDIADVCLVSAYDVANGLCPVAFESLANIVVLDSGLYECGMTPVAIDEYLPQPSGQAWTRESYRRFLQANTDRWPLTNPIVVNYDMYGPIQEQISFALGDFQTIQGVATDFLLKPVKEGAFHTNFEFQELGIGQFDVVGVTERELGPSVMDRCRSLIRLRRALARAGLESPIHVFGSITPAAVTAYFLCGADLFDGLNWLRSSFDQPWAGATSEFAVVHGYAGHDDREVQLELWRRNLHVLRRTQANLSMYAEGGSVDSLCKALPFANASLELARMALEAEGGE